MIMAASIQGSPFQTLTCQSLDHLLSYGVIVTALMFGEASIMLLIGWLIGVLIIFVYKDGMYKVRKDDDRGYVLSRVTNF
jgi:hypothetical protein